MLKSVGHETDGLMQGIAAGDREALAELFAIEGARLVAVARRIVRRTDLAEEVVQDSFVAIWQRARQFDPRRGSARVWVTTIVRNRALNLIRDASRMENHAPDTLESLSEREADAESAYAGLADIAALKGCLGALEPSRRRAILLCYVTGLSHGEVAATLRTPLGTVKAWIRRGLVSLQECLS